MHADQTLFLLTIGHSRHPMDKFLELLLEHKVDVLVDVRSRPFSRFAPQFSRQALEVAITEASIKYLFMGNSLGGRPESRECYDANGKVDYSRVEKQEIYRHGIDRLIDGATRFRVCILCAEEDPARCHRRLLITRTLVERGVNVRHIRGSGIVETDVDLEKPSAPKQLELLPREHSGKGRPVGNQS